MTIEKIKNDIALLFLKQNKAYKEMVFIRKHDEWFGAFYGNELIATAGYSYKKGYITLGGCFTVLQFRKKGIQSLLLLKILYETKGKRIISFSRPEMARINEKYGFKTKYTYKNGTKKMEFDNE